MSELTHGIFDTRQEHVPEVPECDYRIKCRVLRADVAYRDEHIARLEAAINRWKATGAKGFPLCVSGDGYFIQISFKTLEDAHAHFEAMRDLGRATPAERTDG